MKRLLLFIILISVVFSFAQQEEGASLNGQNLTVAVAVELALKNNPGLNALAAKRQQLEGEKLQAMGLPSPEISYMKEGIGGDSNAPFAEQRWTISQSIDFPLTTLYRQQRFSSSIEAAALQQQAYEADLKAEIRKVYTELQYGTELMHLAYEEINLAKRLREAIRVKLEVGEASELDLMKAEITYSEAANKLSDATQVYHEARYRLFNLTGLDADEQLYTIEFPDTLVYVQINLPQDEIIDNINNRPEFLAAVKEVEASASGVSEAWSSALPDFNLMFYKQDYGAGYNLHGFEVGVSVPLWFFFNERGRIQQAGAARRETEWRKKEVYLKLKEMAETAWHSYDASRQNIRRYQKQIKEKSQELAHLMFEGYQLGEIDLLTLLDAQKIYVESQREYYGYLRDYYIRLIDIEKYLGRDLVFTNAN